MRVRQKLPTGKNLAGVLRFAGPCTPSGGELALEVLPQAQGALDVVDDQGVGDAVFVNDAGDRRRLLADVDDDDLFVIVDHIRREGVAVGLLEDQQLLAVLVLRLNIREGLVAAHKASA